MLYRVAETPLSHLRYIDACEHGTWHLMLSEVTEDGEVLPEGPHKWSCRSWRHPGPCRQWRGALDYERIKVGLSKGKDWVVCVLTFSQSEWPDWKRQYDTAYLYWSALRCRLRRVLGRFRYIQTWERHQTEGIHVNLLIDSLDLARSCYEELRAPFKEMRWFSDLLEYHAVEVGFGPVHWAEPMRLASEERLAGYMTKLANELIGANAKNQVPFDAPPHFRRIRASRGLLPKVIPHNFTGRIVFAPYPEELIE